MKVKKLHVLLLLVSLQFTTVDTKAQLGGLLKKAKEAVKPTNTSTAEVKKAENATITPTENKKVNEEKTGSQQNKSTQLIIEYPQGEKDNIIADPALFSFQDKYVGQIVFAKEKLSKDKTVETIFTNKFNFGDAIYARAFLKNPIYNYPIYYPGPSASRNDNHNWFVQVTINGDRNKTNSFIAGDNNAPKYKGWTTWQLFFYAKGEDAVENKDWFVQVLNNLLDGEHNLEMELYGGRDRIAYTNGPIAKGTFTITKAGGKKLGVGRTWGVVNSKMKNNELEKQMVQAMKEKAASEGWKEDFSKAKITVDDWNVVKNEYTGEKLYRTIEGVIYAKWPEGHCTMQEFSFSQDWKGTAFSKSLSCSGIGNQTTIDCD
jgi:hypothetical protein